MVIFLPALHRTQKYSSTMQRTMQHNCPLCKKKRINSKMKAMQINMQEAVWVCENENCIWPVGYQDLKFISRPAGKEWSFHWNKDQPKNVTMVKPKEVDQIPVDLALYTPPVTPIPKDTPLCDSSNTMCNNNLNDNLQLELDNSSQQSIGNQSLTKSNSELKNISELPPRSNDNVNQGNAMPSSEKQLSIKKSLPTGNSNCNNLSYSQDTNDCVKIDFQILTDDSSKSDTVVITNLNIPSLTKNKLSTTDNVVEQTKKANIGNQILEQRSVCKQVVAQKPNENIKNDEKPDLIKMDTNSHVATDDAGNYGIMGTAKKQHTTITGLKNSVPIAVTENELQKETLKNTETKMDQSPKINVETPQDHSYVSSNRTIMEDSGLFKRKSSSKQYKKFSFQSIKKLKQPPPTEESNAKSITPNVEQPVTEGSNSTANQSTSQPFINENVESNNLTFQSSNYIINTSQDIKIEPTLEDCLQEYVDEVVNYERNSPVHEQSILTANISSLLDEYLTPEYEILTKDIHDDWLLSLLS